MALYESISKILSLLLLQKRDSRSKDGMNRARPPSTSGQLVRMNRSEEGEKMKELHERSSFSTRLSTKEFVMKQHCFNSRSTCVHSPQRVQASTAAVRLKSQRLACIYNVKKKFSDTKRNRLLVLNRNFSNEIPNWTYNVGG